MSTTNGVHLFLYIVLVRRGTSMMTYVLRSDHDPEQEEIAALFDLALGPEDEMKAARYEYDSLPVLPPKETTPT